MIIYDEPQSQELTAEEIQAAATHKAHRKRVLNAISAGKKLLSKADFSVLKPQEKIKYAHAGGQME